MKKIVILGPESTGKSTLSAQLAEHYHTIFCPEFAREYLMQHAGNYSYGDLLEIGKGQISLEEKMLPLARNGVYIIDTDLYVIKVWCEVAFENCHKWILQQIASRSYDLHLLCDVDLPWIPDALREYPDLSARKKHFKMYKDAMINSGKKWSIVSGSHSERLAAAIRTVDALLKPTSTE